MARYAAESPAIKLYHLRNALVGKAAGVIDQDIINNGDYEAAWAILTDRFEDKRLIIDKHIKAIFTLPKIAKDSSIELRKLVDACVKNIQALENLELEVDGLGEQNLINQLASKMDRDRARCGKRNRTQEIASVCGFHRVSEAAVPNNGKSGNK